MAARTVARYQVGGHLLMVSAADGTDVRSLLPSYERFGVEDDGAEPLVHVDVDPSRAMWGSSIAEAVYTACSSCPTAVTSFICAMRPAPCAA